MLQTGGQWSRTNNVRPFAELAEVVFQKGETRKCIEIPMIDNGLYKKNVTFNVVLYECSGGATSRGARGKLGNRWAPA